MMKQVLMSFKDDKDIIAETSSSSIAQSYLILDPRSEDLKTAVGE